MPEKVLSSLMKMTAAMQRMPRQEAERLAYEAAIRAEAVAEYAENINKKEDNHETENVSE
nr:MAG TPA: hypothetical protein [Bacteriophage sp.]